MGLHTRSLHSSVDSRRLRWRLRPQPLVDHQYGRDSIQIIENIKVNFLDSLYGNSTLIKDDKENPVALLEPV